MKNLSVILILSLFIPITVFSQSCLPNGITFSTQAQIDSFQIDYPGCTDILGDVSISGDDISNLVGLSELKIIEGDFEIGNGTLSNNQLLSNLSGLDSLKMVIGSFRINFNGLLSDLSGLNGLSYVGGRFDIFENEELISLSGLNSLNYVEGGEFSITGKSLIDISALSSLDSLGQGFSLVNCYKLTNLTGLENLTKINGGGFALINDSALVDIESLENLTIIDGVLLIWNNSKLVSLSGLENVTSNVYWLSITGNESLLNIEGVANLTGDSLTRLDINNNLLLNECDVQSICDYLALPEGNTIVENNAPGCNSPEEVEEACLVGISDIVAALRFTIYPNPTSNEIHISSDNGVVIDKVNIYNQLGQKVYSQNQFSNPVSVSVLKPGIYIIELVTDKIITRDRLIIK